MHCQYLTINKKVLSVSLNMQTITNLLACNKNVSSASLNNPSLPSLHRCSDSDGPPGGGPGRVSIDGPGPPEVPAHHPPAAALQDRVSPESPGDLHRPRHESAVVHRAVPDAGRRHPQRRGLQLRVALGARVRPALDARDRARLVLPAASRRRVANVYCASDSTFQSHRRRDRPQE